MKSLELVANKLQKTQSEAVSSLTDALMDMVSMFEECSVINGEMADYFAEQLCDRCGSPHDDEGYGYMDDGEECSEDYPLGGMIEPYDMYVENELLTE